jgi:hypothetical protein
MPEMLPNSELSLNNDIMFLKQNDETLRDNSRRSKVADVENSSVSHPLILSSRKKSGSSGSSVLTSIKTWFQDVPSSSSSSPSDVPMEISYGSQPS